MMSLLTPIVFIIYIYLGRKKSGIALLTCPFVCGAIFLLGTFEENLISVFGSPVILCTTLLVILFTKPGPDKEDWPRIFTRYFLSIILFLSAGVLLAILFGPFSAFAILFLIIFTGSMITYSLTSRYTTASFVLSTIGSSIRQNLPLPMALEFAASGISDKRVRILQRIKSWLVQGYSLSESIRKGYPGCPGHALAMIATAERIDQVPHAIQMIEDDIAAKLREKNRLKPIHPIYPIIVLAFLFFIVWAFFLFIVPQYSRTISEVTEGGALPAITRHVLGIAGFMMKYFGVAFLFLFAVIFLIVIPFSIYIKFRPRKPEDPYMFSLMGDRIKWHLPISHWFEMNYSMVQAIEMLRLSLNAGCTVNEAIANTIDMDVNCCFRDRLKDWLEKVEAGSNISESAKQSKLGSALAWAFDEKVNQGNTIAILETLESLYRTNYNYHINLARFIFWPCVVLCIGVTVGFIVVALFYPGVEMINNLANMISP
jgi:type II secretory pathway component PulF